MKASDLDNSVLTKPPMIYLFLAQALLFVVVEFLQEKCAIPTSIQSDVDAVYDGLKKLRNAIFHAQTEYISPKLIMIGNVPDSREKIQRIHSVLGSFLCNPANQPAI